MKEGTAQAWVVAVASFYLLMKLTPSIPQPQMYHDFADKREFFGIPNALNVISNLPFMVIGLIGLMLCHRSNYFNLRLPMTVAFASLVAILIIERVDAKKGTISIFPLIMAAMISSVYWRFFGDIRPYLLVQTVSCIAVPLMAYLLPPMYAYSTYWLWAAGFYPLAMMQETADRLIYAVTFHTVSGHTLKHLSAGMVPLILTIMLAKRRLLHAKSA